MDLQRPDLFSDLRRIQNAQFSARRLPMIGREVGDTDVCPQCGDPVTLCATDGQYSGRPLYYWTECTCWRQQLIRAGARVEAAVAKEAGRFDPAAADDSLDLRQVAHMTLDAFDASRFDDRAPNPYSLAVRWLDLASTLPCAHSTNGPPAALFFYSDGKGRGKTHLAAGLALKAQAMGHTVAFADEIGYVERYWASSLEGKAALAQRVGVRSWLTVIDDLGQRESRPASLRDLWYEIINPRGLKRGWTIVTSNRTPDQLLEQQTINQATYSRLIELTRGRLIEFVATDHRLEH